MGFNDVINTSIKAPLWFCRSIGVTPPQRTHLHFKWELNCCGAGGAQRAHIHSLCRPICWCLCECEYREAASGDKHSAVLQRQEPAGRREPWLLTGQEDQLVFSAISSKAYFYFDFIPRPSSFLTKSAEQGGTGWDHLLCRCGRHKYCRRLVVRCRWESK